MDSSFLSENNINGLTADVGDRNVYLKCSKPIVIGVVNLQVISYVRTTSQPETVYLLHSVLRTMKGQSQCLSRLVSNVTLWPSLCDSFLVSHKPHSKAFSLSQSISEEEEYLNDEGRILLRYSGTEPKVRLLVEGKSHKKIEGSFQRLMLAIKNRCKW